MTIEQQLEGIVRDVRSGKIGRDKAASTNAKIVRLLSDLRNR